MAQQKPPDYRIYDRYGNRKYLPPIVSADWELTEGGWFGSANIQISKDFSGLHDFDGFDTLEIWFGGVRRYRGKIICPQQDLQIPESWTLQCMGLVDRLNTIRADKRYVYPGGVDVSQAFARLAMDYILTRITPLATDIQEVGFTVENLVFENVSVREAIGSLIEQCAKRAVWGFDVDDAGLDRLFFRPKVDEPVYHYPVGGRVKHYSYPPDYGNIVNTVKLIGSESKYPNLLTNPSFEQPKVADVADGNLVFNPSFELTDGESGLASWNLSSNAWWVYPGHVPKGDQAWPRTGNKCVELDCAQGPDEYAETKNGAQYNITAGQTYLWEFWHYNPNAGRYRVTATFSDNSVMHFPGADSTYLVMGVGATGKYRRSTGQFKAPAGVTWVKLRITQTENSPNFRIDDVALYQVDSIVQAGWQIQYSASVDDAANDYACDLAAYHGGYSVRLKGYVLAGREIRLIQRYEQRLTIEPSTYYQSAAWVYPMNVARVRLVAWVVKDSGAGRWEYGQSYLLEDLNQWHQLLWNDLGWLTESDDRYAQIALLVIDNTENRDIDLLVDAMYFGLWASDNEINNGVYCPARNYEFELNTDQAFVQNDSRLSAEIKASRTTYGIREARETVAEITNLTQAQNWAIGYFGIHAEPVAAHRCDIVLNDDEVIQPDGQLRLVGSDVPPAFVSRARYSLKGDDPLSCSVDLNTERPSFEGLLTKVLRQSRSAARDAR